MSELEIIPDNGGPECPECSNHKDKRTNYYLMFCSCPGTSHTSVHTCPHNLHLWHGLVSRDHSRVQPVSRVSWHTLEWCLWMSRVVHHLVNSHSRPGRTAVAGTDPSSSIYVTITDRLVTFAFSQVNKLIRYHRNISYLSYLHNKEQTQELLEYPAENQDGWTLFVSKPVLLQVWNYPDSPGRGSVSFIVRMWQI